MGTWNVKQDLTGQRFGRLTVIEEAGRNKSKKVLWRCVCDCGKETIVIAQQLTSGRTKSCGCLVHDVCKVVNVTHGMSGTRLHKIWCNIIDRCTNENSPSYKNYGGRGIKICNEWRRSFQSFYDWAMSHGYKENLTIDRVDNNGDYCPDNCRWTDKLTQANNTRNNHYIEYNGERHSTAEWARILNISYPALKHRIERGWTTEEAFSGKRNPK